MNEQIERIGIKEINRLAIPAIMAGITEPLIGLVDTAFIGHIGSSELAAVGIAASFFSLVIWVLSQTKTAISTIVARSFGSGGLAGIRTLIPQAILLNLLLGGLFFAATNSLSTWIFEFYGAKGAVLSNADNYFSIRSSGFPLVLGTYAIFGVFRGLQNTGWAMVISLIGGGLNLLLDPLLIFGWDGIIPAMGVEGAAYASLCAQFAMFGLAIFYLLKRTQFNLALKFQLHPEIGLLLGMSGNLFLRTMALNVAYFLANRFATVYGDAHIAAHTIAMNIWLFSAFFIDGYANAGNALSGRLLGEKNPKAIWMLGKDLCRISVLISMGLSAFYGIGYFFTARIFTEDQEVILLFNSIYWLVIITQPVNAIAFAFDGIFKGLGHTAFLRNLLFLGTILVFIPAIYLGDHLGWQLHSIWIAFFCWMLIRSGVPALRFRKHFKPK